MFVSQRHLFLFLCLAAAASPASLSAQGKSVAIPVPKADIPAGTKLEASLFTTRSIAKAVLPLNVIDHDGRLKGGIARVTLRANLPMLDRDLAYSDDLRRELEPEYRAVTLSIGENDLGIDLILPGQWVDVLGMAKDAPEGQGPKTLMQNVKVLAVGESVNYLDRPRNPTSITLEVKPADGRTLLGARARGPIGITLRKPGDNFIQEVP